MLFGLILLSQTQLFNKKNQWISSGYYFNKASGNLGLGIICVVAFLVVLASSSLPLKVVTNNNKAASAAPFTHARGNGCIFPLFPRPRPPYYRINL